MMFIEILPPLLGHFSADSSGFDALMKVDGEVYRDVKGRRTVKFVRANHAYFIKSHAGFPWKDMLKTLLSLTRPVTGARQEWLGVQALERLAVPTMTVVSRGERGWMPGTGGSFIVTKSLQGMVSLEDLLEAAADWPSGQAERLKRHLIVQLADISRKLHQGGVNHRDFYLCHFLVQDRDWSEWTLNQALTLHVIDLHRVQVRSKATPTRWRTKDLGALMYSAFGANLTVTDAVRFIRTYYRRANDWKTRYRTNQKFWYAVVARALGFQHEWDRQQARAALREL